jgi:hypothetical protein
MESQSEPQPIKEKRQLSEKQLEQLAKAREKGNAVRKKNAELKRKAKQVNQMKQQQEEDALDQELASLTKAPLKRTRKAPQLVAQEDLVSSSSSESESEPEPEPVKRKAVKVKRKKPVHVPSSDESSDEDYVPNKRIVRRQKMQDSMYDRQMQRAFGSLFPNYNL